MPYPDNVPPAPYDTTHNYGEMSDYMQGDEYDWLAGTDRTENITRRIMQLMGANPMGNMGQGIMDSAYTQMGELRSNMSPIMAALNQRGGEMYGAGKEFLDPNSLRNRQTIGAGVNSALDISAQSGRQAKQEMYRSGMGGSGAGNALMRAMNRSAAGQAVEQGQNAVRQNYGLGSQMMSAGAGLGAQAGQLGLGMSNQLGSLLQTAMGGGQSMLDWLQSGLDAGASYYGSNG